MTKARDLSNIISGGFTADDIPSLDTAKITTGTFDASRIGSGTFADARISASSVSQHATSFDDTNLKTNVAINSFNIAVNGGLSLQNMVDGTVDEFTDETGIATGSTTNSYNSSGNYYTNPITVSASETEVDYPNVTITHDGSSGIPVSNLYDNDLNSDVSIVNSPNALNIIYDLGTPRILSRVVLKSSTGSFARNSSNTLVGVSITINGSNDNSTYTLLDTQNTSGSANETKTSTITDSTPYRYLKITIPPYDSSSDKFLAEAEVYYYATTVGNGDAVLISNATTALSEPTESFIVIKHQPVDAVTLNTDIKAYASRDNGTQWVQGTLSKVSDITANQDILVATVDLSSANSGTSMKYKIETFNKEQRIYAVSQQWS